VSNLHIQDEQHPKLTLCGRWARAVTLLGDDFDSDERTVCLGCTLRALALRIRDRIRVPPTLQTAAERRFKRDR
jgi:hypothetical protein